MVDFSNPKKQEALRLALETRSHIYNDSSSLSSVLRKCATICTLLEKSHDNEWIKKELQGYQSDGKEGKPRYRRKSKLVLFNVNDAPKTLLPDGLDSIKDHFISNPISELENIQEKGLLINEGLQIEALRKYFKFVTVEAQISSTAVRGVVEAVKTRALRFLNSTIMELEYGEIPANIFDEIRREVDARLVRISDTAIEELKAIYEQLVQESCEGGEWSHVVGACIKIIKRVADRLFFPREEPYTNSKGVERPVTDVDITNRLCAYVDKKIDGTEVKRFTKAHIQYIANFLEELQSFANTEFSDNITKNEANRCVIYTYLLLGDILRLQWEKAKQY